MMATYTACHPERKLFFDVYVAHYGNSVLGIAHIFPQDGLKAAA